MAVPYPLDYLDRFLRETSSYDYSISAYTYDWNNSYSDTHFPSFDFCNLRPSGFGWEPAITLTTISIGILISIIFLVVVFRDLNLLDSSFLFVNNFFFASFMNLMTDGLLKISFYRSFCWSAGRLACKTSFTVVDGSENAMTFFLTVFILEQNHPRIYSFFCKNVPTRRLVATVALWVVTLFFSVPEMFLYDLRSYLPGAHFCTLGHLAHRHISIYYHKAVLIEFFIPLVLLVVTCIHAAILLRRSNTSHSETMRPVVSDNETMDESANESPQMRRTSLILGGIFFVSKMPHYLAMSLISIYRYRHSILFNIFRSLSEVMYPVPSTIAPILVLFSSPIHKKRLTETYQSIASCFAGRRVQRGFTLGTGDGEEKLEEIKMETEGE